MCIYTCTCIYTHIYIHGHAYTHTETHTHEHTYMCRLFCCLLDTVSITWKEGMSMEALLLLDSPLGKSLGHFLY